jgi:hypothetical protein
VPEAVTLIEDVVEPLLQEYCGEFAAQVTGVAVSVVAVPEQLPPEPDMLTEGLQVSITAAMLQLAVQPFDWVTVTV